MAQSNPRKEIRTWFKQALSAHANTLGPVFSKRVVIFDDPDNEPDTFTNIYIADGQLRESDQGMGALTYLSVDIGFHRKQGGDDELDHMEFIAERALLEYDKTHPSPFSFYKTGFTYAGDSEDAYEQLYLSFQVITR